MKKVLVTGATGFIGSYVIDDLLSRGYQVIASSSNRETATQKKWFNQVKFIEMMTCKVILPILPWLFLSVFIHCFALCCFLINMFNLIDIR